MLAKSMSSVYKCLVNLTDTEKWDCEPWTSYLLLLLSLNLSCYLPFNIFLFPNTRMLPEQMKMCHQMAKPCARSAKCPSESCAMY